MSDHCVHLKDITAQDFSDLCVVRFTLSSVPAAAIWSCHGAEESGSFAQERVKNSSYGWNGDGVEDYLPIPDSS